MNFETAPFKLTKEYIEVLGGLQGEMFKYFKCLMIRGFYEVKRHIDDILNLIDIMAQGKG
jgi:phosphatidylinositol 4-kinase B